MFPHLLPLINQGKEGTSHNTVPASVPQHLWCSAWDEHSIINGPGQLFQPNYNPEVDAWIGVT